MKRQHRWLLRRRELLDHRDADATPQKLQLLLVEAAIRSARRAGQEWRGRQTTGPGIADPRPGRRGRIAPRRQAGVSSALTDRVAAVYAFIFRRLAEAGYTRDRRTGRRHPPAGNRARDVAAGVPADGHPAARRSGRESSLADSRGRTPPTENPEPFPSGGLSLEA